MANTFFTCLLDKHIFSLFYFNRLVVYYESMYNITKKLNIEKIMKEIKNTSVEKSEKIMKEEINKEKLNLLMANEETIRPKLNAVKI